MDTTTHIRAYDPDTDLAALRACVIELQDFEAGLYERLPSGTEVVDDCIQHMFEQCEKCRGRIMVAEDGGDVAGFVTILCEVWSEEPDDGDLVYGLVSDLAVLEKYRGRGIGRRLLAAAESHARSRNVNWLRIGVLAGNGVAESIYKSMGFSPWYVECEKRLGPPSGPEKEFQ